MPVDDEPMTSKPGTTGRLFGLTRGEGLRAQLVRGGVGSIGLKVANMVLGLALSIVLARALEPSGYGIYAAVMAVVTLLGVPAQLGLQNLLVREVAAYELREEWALLRGVLHFSFLVVVGMTVVVLVGAGLFALGYGSWFKHEEVTTMLWGLTLLPFLALGGLRGAALRGLRRVTQGQVPEFLFVPGLTVAFVATYLLLRESLTPSRAMAFRAMATVIAFAVGAWLLARALPASWRRFPAEYHARRWLMSTLPLSFAAGVQVLHAQTGIIMLGIFRSPADVGLYRVAVQGAALVAFTLSAAGMVLGPHIARLFVAGERGRLQRMMTWSTRLMLIAALPTAVIFIVFGEEALQLLFGEPYQAASPALAILCIGQLFHAATGAAGLFLIMTGHETDMAMATAVTAALNIVLNVILVPAYGITGAAIATAVALATLKVLLYRTAVRRTGIDSLAIRLVR
jgi:O-antigen/teichoic acid export membrane protein